MILQNQSEGTSQGKAVPKRSRSRVAGMRDETRKLPCGRSAKGLDGYVDQSVGTSQKWKPLALLEENNDENSTCFLERYL